MVYPVGEAVCTDPGVSIGGGCLQPGPATQVINRYASSF